MNNKFISFIRNKGLEAPAVIILEVCKPISFLMSQFILFFSPFINIFTTNDKTVKFSEFLSDRKNIESLIETLEKSR